MEKNKLLVFLSFIPSEYLMPITDLYIEIKERHYISKFRNDKHDTVGQTGGKLCEVLMRYIISNVTGNPYPLSQKIQNLTDELNRIKNTPSVNDSLRISIPNSLIFTYGLRNKRNIGHYTPDIDPNDIDASTIVKNIDWIICELIRVKSNKNINDIQGFIQQLSSNIIPQIWEIGGRLQVLDNSLNHREKLLLSLYKKSPVGITQKEALEYIRYKNASRFRNDLLPKYLDECCIYITDNGTIHITPKGIYEVENIIIRKYLN